MERVHIRELPGIPLTQIRQVVAEYSPGRRIAFRFAPGLGIVGTHRLEVDSLGRAELATSSGARTVAVLPSDLLGGLENTYQRLDLALYTPLCLGLAAGTAIAVGQTDGSITGGPQ